MRRAGVLHLPEWKGAEGEGMTPPYTAPAKCPVCQTCWKNPITGRCQYGGPYDGYRKVLEGFFPVDVKNQLQTSV